MRNTIITDRSRGIRGTGVVVYKDRILLMRLKFGKEIFYNLPGGGWEQGETIEDTVKREIIEEFNLDVSVNRLLYIIDSEDRMNFVFLCKTFSSSIKLGDEEKARSTKKDRFSALWIPIDKLNDINIQPKETKIALIKYFKRTDQPTFFISTYKKINKKILIVAPSGIEIPPKGYGGIERIVELAYKKYQEEGYSVDIISKPGSSYHNFDHSNLSKIKFDKYKFVLSYCYDESLLNEINKYDPQLNIILQNNYNKKYEYLKSLYHVRCFVLSKDQQKQYFTALKQEYQIIPNGIDLSIFKINNIHHSRDKDIVYIGAIGQHKSPLECLKYAIKHNLSIDFYGPEVFRDDEQKYKELFYKLLSGYNKSRLLGELKGEHNKAKLLNEYKYFIFLPSLDKGSWIEPFGIAPLEAMACGCTVITQYIIGGHRTYCNTTNSISYKDKPHQLDSNNIRASILDYDFNRVFDKYYPK